MTLNVTAMNVALPQIGHDLPGSSASLRWVIDGYTLTSAALLLTGGSLADRIGAVRACVSGLAVFAVSCAIGGMAPSLTVLTVSRLVQGCAAAVVVPASLAIVRQEFPGVARQARAIGFWTASGGAAIAGGPVIAGALVLAFGWRSVCFASVPVAAGAAVLLAGKRNVRLRRCRLNLLGQTAATISLAAVTYTLNQGFQAFGDYEFLTGTLGTFLVSVMILVFTESRCAQPMIPLGMFRVPAVAVCMAIGFTLSFALYGMLFVLGLYAQQVRGQSPLEAGLLFLPMAVGVTVVNASCGTIFHRFGPRFPVVAGQCVVVAGLIVLLGLGTSAPVAALAVLVLPLGVGSAMVTPVLTTVLLDTAGADIAGVVSGVLNAGRQVGAGIGVALCGALVTGQTSFTDGLRSSLWVSAAVVLVTMIAAVAVLGRRPAKGGPA